VHARLGHPPSTPCFRCIGPQRKAPRRRITKTAGCPANSFIPDKLRLSGAPKVREVRLTWATRLLTFQRRLLITVMSRFTVRSTGAHHRAT